MKIKIGVISDTHIPDKSISIPQQILDEFKSMDIIIHAGDILDESVLNTLKSICNRVIAVSGNMDPEEIKKILPQKEMLLIGKFRIGIMHGYGAPNHLIQGLEAAFKEDRVDLVIFGHSHNPVNEKRGEIIFFNPGSPTDKVFSAYNSYGIIEINDKIEAKIIKL